MFICCSSHKKGSIEQKQTQQKQTNNKTETFSILILVRSLLEEKINQRTIFTIHRCDIILKEVNIFYFLLLCYYVIIFSTFQVKCQTTAEVKGIMQTSYIESIRTTKEIFTSNELKKSINLNICKYLHSNQNQLYLSLLLFINFPKISSMSKIRCKFFTVNVYNLLYKKK